MINDKTILAIIPARAGSKRLPGKNMRPLHGKPMVLWTVEEAIKSQYIDTVVVTTDDQAVIKAVKSFNIQVLDRPPELAADESLMYETIFHVLEYFEPHDYTMLLHPTSPLRIVDDIDGCILTCVHSHAPSCVTVDDRGPDANGVVYFAWTTWLREMQMFDSGRVVCYRMPIERSVDINQMEDFLEAERLLSSRPSGQSLKEPVNSTLP